jgi:uncharacterized membrane protein
MNRSEYLAALRANLSALTEPEIEKALAYYDEIIADRVEDGLTEEEAVAGLDPPAKSAERILLDSPLNVLVKSRLKAQKKPSAIVIILLVLGFPLWSSLLAALLSIVLALYVSLWAVVSSLWLAFGCAAASGIVLVAFGLARLFAEPARALFFVGAGLALIGVMIFAFFAMRTVTDLAVRLTRAIARGIKSLFIRKERE